jgi:hypothetical protein
LQVYFQQIRPLSECVADDGLFVAKLFMDEVARSDTKEKAEPALQRFVSRTAMFRDSGFANIGSLLIAMVSESTGPSDSIAEVVSQSEAPTVTEAIDIGGAFAPSLANHDTAAAAVAAYIEKYVALRKLSETHVWFRPMLETIAGRLKDFDVPHSAIRRSTFHRSTFRPSAFGRQSLLSHPVRVAPIGGGDESGAAGAPVRPYTS